MSVVPTKKIDKVQYFENHITPWETSAVEIGTTVAEVTALETKTQLARQKYNAQQAQRQLAKAATEAFHVAVADMNTAGVGIMQQVRAKAETTGNPYIYELAQIPAPAIPEPKGDPGTPANFTVSFDGGGGVILKWKCANPVGSVGTIYQIWRRDEPTGAFNYLGGVGEKKFTDTTLPAGASQVTYKMQAVRTRAVGLWATFNVTFGTAPATGTATASVTAAPKLAA